MYIAYTRRKSENSHFPTFFLVLVWAWYLVEGTCIKEQNNSMLLYSFFSNNGSRGRTAAANFGKNLVVPLLIRLIKKWWIWKALVQIVCFLILKFNCPHFSITYGYLLWKRPCLAENWSWNDFVKYQDYVESYVGQQIKSFRAHCVL